MTTTATTTKPRTSRRTQYGVMWADDVRPLIIYASEDEARGVAQLGQAVVVKRTVTVTVTAHSGWKIVGR